MGMCQAMQLVNEKVVVLVLFPQKILGSCIYKRGSVIPNEKKKM